MFKETPKERKIKIVKTKNKQNTKNSNKIQTKYKEFKCANFKNFHLIKIVKIN